MGSDKPTSNITDMGARPVDLCMFGVLSLGPLDFLSSDDDLVWQAVDLRRAQAVI